MQWHSAKQAAKIKNVATATIIGLIEDGELEAVNVARRGSVRRRWRISDAMLAAFDERRPNKPAAAKASKALKASKASRRTIQRPTKDYFATNGGVK